MALLSLRRALELIATIALPIAAVAIVIFLVRENRQLRRHLGARLASADHFDPGDRIEPFPARTSAGGTLRVDLTKLRTRVVIVEPSCASCVEALRRLEAEIQAGDRTPTIVVSLASPAETLRQIGPGMAINAYSIDIQSISPQARKKFQGFPQTFLVNNGLIVRTCLWANQCRF